MSFNYNEVREALDEHHAEDLDQLLDEIERAIRKYVVVTDNQLVLLSVWVAHTWCVEAFDFTPYLRIHGATAGVGKTLLAEVLCQLCYDGRMTGSISETAIFRLIEMKRPTLFLDELDKALANRANGEALLLVLNGGFKRSGTATRNVPGPKGEWIAKEFSVFCPKAYQAIKPPPGELDSRSIRIEMKRKLPSEKITRKRDRKLRAEFEHLRQRLEEWSDATGMAIQAHIEADEVVFPEGLSDRACDILEPLLAIGEFGGEERAQRVREAAIEIVAGGETEKHVNELILEDVFSVFGNGSREYVATAELIETLNSFEERPWVSWNRGDGIKPKDIARVLKAFGAKPANRRFECGAVKKSYFLKDLEEAFERHCRHIPSRGDFVATAANSHNGNSYSETPSATVSEGATANPLKTNGSSGIAAVAANAGVTEEGYFAVEVLSKFGGKLQRVPLVTAIRREHDTARDDAELLLDVAVEAGAVLERDGWFTVQRDEVPF